MRVQTSDLWYLNCKLSVFRHYLWGQTVSEQQFGECSSVHRLHYRLSDIGEESVEEYTDFQLEQTMRNAVH